MMMLVLTVCSFEGTWNIDRNEKQCESTVFLMSEKLFLDIEKNMLYLYIKTFKDDGVTYDSRETHNSRYRENIVR